MSKKIEYLSDYAEEARLRKDNFGKTNKHSTGLYGLDAYLGHGYGNRDGYEIITVFGETGVGKSTFALNMIAYEMVNGTKTGLMILEDDMPDVYNRIQSIVGERGMKDIKKNKNVDIIPQEMLENLWTFSMILSWIDDKVTERGIELFLIDHINFVFDNADIENPKKEMAEQRKFMRDLQLLCRKRKITVILISHTAKGESQGMAKVYGTTAIIQVSTKVIGVKPGDGQQLIVQLYKTRFTRRQDGEWILNRTGLKLEEYEPIRNTPVPPGVGVVRKKGKEQ